MDEGPVTPGMKRTGEIVLLVIAAIALFCLLILTLQDDPSEFFQDVYSLTQGGLAILGFTYLAILGWQRLAELLGTMQAGGSPKSPGSADRGEP